MITLEYPDSDVFKNYLKYLGEKKIFDPETSAYVGEGTILVVFKTHEERERFQQSWIKFQVRNSNPAKLFATLGT